MSGNGASIIATAVGVQALAGAGLSELQTFLILLPAKKLFNSAAVKQASRSTREK
jgi:hypothetical protein